MAPAQCLCFVTPAKKIPDKFGKTILGVFLKVRGPTIPKNEQLNRKLTDKYDNDNNKHDPHPTPPSSAAVLLKSLRLQAQLGEVLLCQVR